MRGEFYREVSWSDCSLIDMCATA